MATRELRNSVSQKPWFDDASSDKKVDYPIDQFNVISSPNDFNITTLFNFIKKRVVIIPGFQRNYVWDKRKASKLIESLLVGIPVPQLFFFEQGPNKYLVMDGQQRLMSIYYFIKGKFPIKSKRSELRKIFDECGEISQDIFDDSDYFSEFKLDLYDADSEQEKRPSKLHGLSYADLGHYQTTFDLCTIRCIFIKQVSSQTAIIEIFNRLNTGGTNLNPQEVRMSLLYDTEFHEMLNRLAIKREWRKIVGFPEPDSSRMKNLEIIFRGFAMLIKGGKDGKDYSPLMNNFLDKFLEKAKELPRNDVKYLESLFESFLDSCSELLDDSFQMSSNRFSIPLFEAIFVAVCRELYEKKQFVVGKVVPETVKKLKEDEEFKNSLVRGGTASKGNVSKRLERAHKIIQVR